MKTPKESQARYPNCPEGKDKERERNKLIDLPKRVSK